MRAAVTETMTRCRRDILSLGRISVTMTEQVMAVGVMIEGDVRDLLIGSPACVKEREEGRAEEVLGARRDPG